MTRMRRSKLAQRADELFAEGDVEGYAVWKRFLAAVDELSGRNSFDWPQSLFCDLALSFVGQVVACFGEDKQVTP